MSPNNTPPTTPDRATIRDQIRTFITENFLYDPSSVTLSDTASLLEQGIVDSTGILEIVLFVEEAYGFNVEQDDLLPENFDSVENLTQYVDLRLTTV